MKQKISVAARQHKPKDLSRNHYTTLGFGSPFPIFVEETIPGDKFNLRVSNFSRLAPMFLPNLGTINMKVHAFYVPFRLVWNHFENFVNGLPSWNSSGAQVFKNVPLINDKTLTDLFVSYPENAISLGTSVGSSQTPDFSVPTSNNNEFEHYQFTARGKQIYHMLISLGYNFTFTNNNQNWSSAMNNEYSALPLMCWFKVFLDYYIPSQLQPSSYIHYLFNWIHERTNSQLAQPLEGSRFAQFINEIFSYYQNNYFTSAWMTPNAPVTGLNNIGSSSTDRVVLNSISSQSTVGSTDSMNSILNPVGQDNNGVFSVTRSNNINTQPYSSNLSSDGISLMQKFARYIKRSNFAGSRSVERLLARFGVHADDFQVGMCKYLGSDTIQLQKSDVTVTGSSQEAGDYAGKGFFSGDGHRLFKCVADYSGMIIVTASLEVPSNFIDGVRRRNIHIKPLDFYTPELDGGLMQAISGQELFGRHFFLNSQYQADLASSKLLRDDIFGYTPRYSEYKFALDDVTGDFALPRFSQNIDGFVLPRRIFDMNDWWITEAVASGTTNSMGLLSYAYDPVIASGQAMTPVRSLFSNDMYQFNRIFRDTTGEADPIFSVFKIDCVVNSCSLPLNESAELVGKGKLIDFETNGVHLS